MLTTAIIDIEGTISADLADGVIPPVSKDLVAFYEFGASASKSLVNLASPSGPRCSVVGSPIFAADGMTITTPTDYLDTQLPEYESYTVIAVVKHVEGEGGWIFGNYGAPTYERGTGLYRYSYDNPPTAVLRQIGTTNFNAVDAYYGGYLTDPDFTSWSMMVGVVEAGVRVRTLELIGNPPAISTPLPGTRVFGSGTMLIGKAYRNNFPGSLKILNLAYYKRALPDDEQASMKAYLYALAQERGVTLPAST